jgi:hypothetical protein
LSVLDYSEVIYMQTSVCHVALRFITNKKRLTHHCDLYSAFVKAQGETQMQTPEADGWGLTMFNNPKG